MTRFASVAALLVILSACATDPTDVIAGEADLPDDETTSSSTEDALSAGGKACNAVCYARYKGYFGVCLKDVKTDCTAHSKSFCRARGQYISAHWIPPRDCP